jgi:hypothetical protein
MANKQNLVSIVLTDEIMKNIEKIRSEADFKPAMSIVIRYLIDLGLAAYEKQNK